MELGCQWQPIGTRRRHDEQGGSAMYARIVSDPAVLGGKPVVKGTRISVEFLLELFASGATRVDVLERYPHLTAEDVEEALRYSADVLKMIG